MKIINIEEVLEIIKTTQGKIFGVEFVKKDGSIRAMQARLGVRKGVKGVGMKFDPLERGLLPIYDMNKRTEDGQGAFRMVNLNTVRKLIVGGETFVVK